MSSTSSGYGHSAPSGPAAPTGPAPGPVSAPHQIRPPTWGSWLKANFMKAFMMSSATVYAAYQVLETNYEYRMNGGNNAAGYVLYLAKDTFQDGSWAVQKVSDGMAWAFSSVSGRPDIGHRQTDIVFAVPPSLAHMGWESPEPGSKLEAYKEEVLRQVALTSRMRDEPGTAYYRASNMVILVRDLFDKFTPGAENNPPLVEARIFDAGGPSAPPGYNSYFLDPATRQPKLLP